MYYLEHKHLLLTKMWMVTMDWADSSKIAVNSGVARNVKNIALEHKSVKDI